jgi:hypothetical protein
MLLLEISQADSKIHALKLRKFNKKNSDKGKEKEFSIIIIVINQIIELTTAQLSKA